MVSMSGHQIQSFCEKRRCVRILHGNAALLLDMVKESLRRFCQLKLPMPGGVAHNVHQFADNLIHGLLLRR